MGKEIDWDLEYISGVLSDIEVIDLPWTEIEKSSIGLDWWAAVCRLKDNFNGALTTEQTQYLADIKRRIKAQEEKIRVLDFQMPEL